MKNTPIKIIILVTLVIAVITGVLLFLPTIVLPPDSVPTANLHKKSLESSIYAFNDNRNTAFNDSIYNVVTNKLELYKAEKFMTEEEIDFQIKSLVQNYLPIFIKHSNAKFVASTWRESDHKTMLNRISHLRTLKVDSGETYAVAGSFKSELETIESIIQLYNQACEVANNKTFISANDANTKIQKAEHYKTLDPLKNCVKLVNDLSAVKVNIGRSHYNKVAAKVDELAEYRYMTKKTFDNLAILASDMIDEYNSVCKMYVSYQSTDGISKKANEYYKEAINYYTKPEIIINPGSKWIPMTSPNNLYRAYQSTNYGQHSSSATMTFTIRGYESFTFYIRSNGEVNYDYVVVGLDEKPVGNNNIYASTKGYAQSNTSFYYYKPVNLTKLQKDKTYTIYVIYKKDGSNNSGTDRGYVLIPY